MRCCVQAITTDADIVRLWSVISFVVGHHITFCAYVDVNLMVHFLMLVVRIHYKRSQLVECSLCFQTLIQLYDSGFFLYCFKFYRELSLPRELTTALPR